MLIVRRFCFSLVLLVLAFAAFATDWPRIELAVSNAKSSQDLATVITTYQDSLAEDPELIRWLDEHNQGDHTSDWQDERDSLVALVQTKRQVDGAVGGKVKDPKAAVKAIIKNPAYRDSGTSESKNWLTVVFERFFEWLASILRKLFEQAPRVNPNIPAVPLGGLMYFMWALIIGAILVLLFWAAKNFGWTKSARKVKKGGGILEDDEPDRSADEWLVRANDLEAQGKFREAVRCLYLACLVRLDEANVARFVRSETNWEHLYRISASPKKPPSLDFRPPTSEFDHIWYGFRVKGAEDVTAFRDIYETLCQDLKTNAA